MSKKKTDAATMKSLGNFTIDCDFPGGNIIVDRISDNKIFLRQDRRDTDRFWFYWYFRIRGAAGRTLTFHFTDGNPIGVHGPAVSTDNGWRWSWLGAGCVHNASFNYSFAGDADEVRFCVAIPYLEYNLRVFLARYAHNPALQVDTLCTSLQGRAVELIRLGRLDGNCNHRVLLTCRHHACEMLASYELEGVMDEVLSGTDMGRWLCGHVEFVLVPFMDKDGVENGDQGKSRRPRDHGRDYKGTSIYPETRALRNRADFWSDGRLTVAIDLHCPSIRRGHNEAIWFVGGPDKTIWKRVLHLSEILESVQSGELVFSADDNLPFGAGWNTETNYSEGKNFSSWAEGLPGIQLAVASEFPYASARGTVVTVEKARAFGRDLARALQLFLSETSH